MYAAEPRTLGMSMPAGEGASACRGWRFEKASKVEGSHVMQSERQFVCLRHELHAAMAGYEASQLRHPESSVILPPPSYHNGGAALTAGV